MPPLNLWVALLRYIPPNGISLFVMVHAVFKKDYTGVNINSKTHTENTRQMLELL